MRRCLAVLIVALVMGAFFAVSARSVAATTPEVEAWFQQTWGSKVAAARSEESRVALATELMRYAATAARRDDLTEQRRGLYAAERAYQLGKAYYPMGYRQAAQALILMQKVDRAGRLEYTERLAEMFNEAWGRNRTKYLGSGIEYAQIKVQVAQQRLADLFDRFAIEGDVPQRDVAIAINLCKADYRQAFAAAQSVLSTAASYRSRTTGATQASLDEFVTHHTPLRERIKEGQKQLGDFAADYAAVGNDAFPAPVIDAKARLAEALRTTGQQPEPAPTPDNPPPSTTRPPVAQADPEPAPEPEPVNPDPEPVPEPPVATTDPPPPPTTRRTKGKSVWQQTVCDKCGESFVPEFGSEAKTCYWCLKKDNIFSGANE